jgi:hypothetical protein
MGATVLDDLDELLADNKQLRAALRQIECLDNPVAPSGFLPVIRLAIAISIARAALTAEKEDAP